MRYLLLLFLCAFVSASSFGERLVAESKEGKLIVRSQDESGHSVELAQYVMDPGTRPYLHPVRDASGHVTLTEDRPADHPWQHGIFTGFHRVNGFNYWKEDEGKQRFVRLLTLKAETKQVSWTALIELVDPNGNVVLEEEDHITIHAPESSDLYLVDYDFLLRAKDQNVTFGKFFVGGLSVRMPWDKENPRQTHLNSNGLRNRACEQQRAAWCNVERPFDDQIFGIAIFDHPKNLTYPSGWRADEQGLINPNISALSDWSIPAGQERLFRYRMVVYRGSATQEQLTAHFDRFAAQEDKKASVEWPVYRGDKSAIQYSTLDQINVANVHRLKLAWEYHHGNPEGPSMYSNPLMIDGLLYLTTPRVNVVALDALTGKEVWIFEPARYDPQKRVFHGRNRGLVYWEDSAGGGTTKRRIFNFVRDRIYALDAKTGALIPSFGQNGFIDLRQNLPSDPARSSIEVTTPGIIYKDFLIVGSRVPEDNDSTPGDIRAYNAETGRFAWIFHTVPQKGELGYDSWQWQPGETYGGANPWGGFSLDEQRGLLFCATGAGAGDFIYGGTRKGANLFANCVLALDARTGQRQWHYQTVHHDIWDYDNPPAPILGTITINGKRRDVAIQLTKMGFTFVFDRVSGDPIFPIEERPVPGSRVPGEESWPTQPFPSKPPPLVRQAVFESDLSNVTPESRASALEQFRQRDSGFLYTPASIRGTITTPGHQGGIEWGGGAFDPTTGVLYVNANEAPTINQLKPLATLNMATATPIEKGAMLYNMACTPCHGFNRRGNPPLYPTLRNVRTRLKTGDIRAVLLNGRGIMPSFAQLATNQIGDLVAYLESDAEDDEQSIPSGPSGHYAQIAPFFEDPYGAPAISPPWGTLNAVDLNKGEILWKVPLGEYPQLVAKGVRNTGAKNFGGPVLTAGGIIFIAATPDEKFHAFDKYSGKLLWEYKLPAGGYATPSIYAIGGKEFVVIAAGGGGKLATQYGDSILAFTLPD